MRTARRHAANREDAEDAFQRGFEILLTSAPDLREDELVPWLKTVVKHEAYAITRARARHAPITDDGAPVEQLTAVAVTHDHVESRERGLQGAEALARLKPQEVRALVLKARGLSYREIGELEDWSYTKVNRLLTEGRRAFRRRLAGIQAGAECERMEPLLSLLADGEANGEQVAALRPHLKTCLSCRARLRDFRSAPHDIAALAPAVGSGGDGGRVRTLIEGVLGITQGKSAALAEKAHALTELATSQKLAAVAASAVAVAGGGAAAEEVVTHSPPPPTAVVEPQQRADALAMKEEMPIQAVPQAEEPAASNESAASAPAVGGDAAVPEQALAEPRPDPANEFDPSGAAAAAPVERDSEPGDTSLGAVAPSPAPPAQAPAPVGGAPGGSAPSGSSPPGSSEFAP